MPCLACIKTLSEHCSRAVERSILRTAEGQRGIPKSIRRRNHSNAFSTPYLLRGLNKQREFFEKLKAGDHGKILKIKKKSWTCESKLSIFCVYKRPLEWNKNFSRRFQNTFQNVIRCWWKLDQLSFANSFYTTVYLNMTGHETLRFFGRVKSVATTWKQKAMNTSKKQTKNQITINLTLRRSFIVCHFRVGQNSYLFEFDSNESGNNRKLISRPFKRDMIDFQRQLLSQQAR